MKFVCSVAFSVPADLCDLARACEYAGFDSVAVSDHIVHPQKLETLYPYTDDGAPRWQPFTPWADPLVAIAAMAAVTESLRFLTSVLVLPMRNPFLVAKAVATAACISGNRLSLGIGVGWMKDEFVLLEQDFHSRGARAEEMIELMRALWRGGWVEHHGRFYDFEALEMSPAPTDEVPILVGGVSEPALRRAASLGDGWIADLHGIDELRAMVAKLLAYRADSARAGRGFAVVTALSDAFDLDGYRRAEDAGVTHVITMPWLFYGGSVGVCREQCEGIKRFGEDIIAKM